MSNRSRSFCWLVVLAALSLAFGCSRKPAYSDIDPTKSPANRNQAGSPSNGAQASAPSDAQKPGATGSGNENSQTSQAPNSTTLKKPSFMDPATGAIKDLPSYPRAQRVSVQYGPMQGTNTMSMVLKTTDPMDKITEFYDRIAKENKWTVVDRITDPEYSEWTLSKSNENSAKVQVKKDQLSSSLDIVIVRAEKVEDTSK